MLHVDSSSLRGFKDRATEAAIDFKEKFHDIPHPGRTRNKKGILAAFAAEHRHFLTAADLSTVMSPGTGGAANETDSALRAECLQAAFAAG